MHPAPTPPPPPSCGALNAAWQQPAKVNDHQQKGSSEALNADISACDTGD